jgi:hypothetical protein
LKSWQLELFISVWIGEAELAIWDFPSGVTPSGRAKITGLPFSVSLLTFGENIGVLR